MRSWSQALVLLLVSSGAALAQPTPDDPPPPNPNPAPPTEPPPRAVPAPAPAPAPYIAPMARPADEYRPDSMSIGIGLGYALPVSLQTPNITSVRLRLPSGITFEPTLTLASSSHDVDTGPSVKDEATEITLAALGRFPVVRHGRVDLEILGGLRISQSNVKPDAPDLDQSTTAFSAVYGVAVTSWINRHWQISFSALNPIITTNKVDQEMGPGTSTVTTDTTIGVIFDPAVFVMVHLYH